MRAKVAEETQAGSLVLLCLAAWAIPGVGHLWQGRFKACVLDEAHLWNAVRYVEQNPVRAGIVNRAEDYKWSSAAAHCGLREEPILSADLPHWCDQGLVRMAIGRATGGRSEIHSRTHTHWKTLLQR